MPILLPACRAQVAFDLVENTTQFFLSSLLSLLDPPAVTAPPLLTEGEGEANNATETQTPTIEAGAPAEASESDQLRKQKRVLLLGILTGEVPIGLTLEFLFRSNHADISILTVRSSHHMPLTHSAAQCLLTRA